MLKSIIESPHFKEGVFLFALVLLLGGFKFAVEAQVDS